MSDLSRELGPDPALATRTPASPPCALIAETATGAARLDLARLDLDPGTILTAVRVDVGGDTVVRQSFRFHGSTIHTICHPTPLYAAADDDFRAELASLEISPIIAEALMNAFHRVVSKYNHRVETVHW